MNIAQKNFLLLPASRFPEPHMSPFLSNQSIKDCEPKPIHQGEGQREIKTELTPSQCVLPIRLWSATAPFCRSKLFALLSDSQVFLWSLFGNGISNTLQLYVRLKAAAQMKQVKPSGQWLCRGNCTGTEAQVHLVVSQRKYMFPCVTSWL
jgi:hypothetical protein